MSLILDSITEYIAVIDQAGAIHYVNKSWEIFGSSNACEISHSWSGVNYIDECDKASTLGDDLGARAADGIRSVIKQDEPIFYLEYPCHGPEEKRWFMMRVTPLRIAREGYVVISHQNITQRKLAEEEVKNLATLDGLTGIPNRRAFDDFLRSEWKRCLRHKKPISLAMVDLDHFKSVNDACGHQYGDECLVKVGALLKTLDNRPGDICARYGGEEFVLLWADTPLEQARRLSNSLLKKIRELRVPNSASPTEGRLSASIGVAEIVPGSNNKESDLIAKADSMLYRAKGNGRNRVES